MLVTLFLLSIPGEIFNLKLLLRVLFVAGFYRSPVRFDCFFILFSHHKAFLLYRKSRKSVRFFR